MKNVLALFEFGILLNVINLCISYDSWTSLLFYHKWYLRKDSM